jgi:PIN domain nuclease of toxin-antitoxin system
MPCVQCAAADCLALNRSANEHALYVENLPPIHKDPFNRILIAQANVEGITLLTSDELVAKCSGPVHYV